MKKEVFSLGLFVLKIPLEKKLSMPLKIVKLLALELLWLLEMVKKQPLQLQKNLTLLTLNNLRKENASLDKILKEWLRKKREKL